MKTKHRDGNFAQVEVVDDLYPVCALFDMLGKSSNKKCAVPLALDYVTRNMHLTGKLLSGYKALDGLNGWAGGRATAWLPHAARYFMISTCANKSRAHREVGA